jgi:hypothetical protein
MVTDSGVVALDGDRKIARILDLDTLRVVRDVPLPANSRTDVSDDGTVAGPFWVGHRRFDYDELAGKETYIGATRVVPAGSPETRSVPPCGAANGVQPDARTLVVNVECAYQIAIIDLPTGSVTTLPSMLSRVDITLQGGDVWARWKNLGYIGRLDLVHRRMTMLDLNADGPLLAGIFGLHMDDGAIWVSGVPADSSLPHITYRIDPRTVRVTARVWSNSLAILNGKGFTVSDDGGLETFDPAAISGDAPRDVVRPSTDPPKKFTPQNATQQEVLRDFYDVYDPSVPNGTAARHLPNDPRLLLLRTKLIKLAHDVYKGVRVVVTDLAVQNGRASVSYTFELGTTAAFFPLSAQLVQTGTGWIVTTESICYLASAAAVGTCQ